MIKEDKRPKDENGEPHGYWERYDDNGGLLYKGYFIHGKDYGYWEAYHYNGQLWYKGKYIYNKKHGYWEFYYNNGDLRYKGYYYMGEELHQTNNGKILL